MPSNLIEINGNMRFELSDSKMPALLQFLSTFTRVPEEGDTLSSQFGLLMREVAKAHYGKDFEFEKCTIERLVSGGDGEDDPERDIAVVTFDLIDQGDYGDKLKSFEPPISEELYSIIE